ncbi:redoxin domain-containing protein [Sphingomonas sp. MAH-20]|uniref:thioredoxin-dependent peroxiredoxin n=1 Tax=Sphingomonas horti TaxID=2682842 RepID=A0A6I4IZN0_9SPHN|nr:MULTISPECIES: peroxiredoxin [Sphingomonas]MBA2920807.1 peroxiredoxin [Sphingomonas sp. CGMCC 1.13658]MVO77742.1 redoxin domain-containing protein [Sphingomonas horti]
MIRTALALSLLLSPAPAFAALAPGATAPDFATQGALAGKAFSFSLKQALKKGPVVLYFYPKSFTTGCTIEAHEFAEATPEFNKLGATVIGMSGDDIDTLKRFSTEECRDKFAVAAASPEVIKAYDVTLPVMASRSNRTSYVIAPNGKIVFAYTAMKPEGHVAGTLDAVKKWKAKK